MTDLLTKAAAKAAAEPTPSQVAESDAVEAAKLGALARAKQAREDAAESAAYLASDESGRAVRWQRHTRTDGERRAVTMRADAGTYTDRQLAALASRAAREAAQTAAKGRKVKGATLPAVRLSEAESESLAAELALAIMEADPQRARERRNPKPGSIGAALATGKLAAAIDAGETGGYPADLQALRAKALDLIRSEGGRQDWRDCAEAVRRGGESADLFLAGEGEAKADLLAQGEAQAHADAYLTGAQRHPLTAETQATIYLTGWSRKRRRALLTALAGRKVTSAQLAALDGAASATAIRQAAAEGRKAIRADLLAAESRAETAAKLEAVAAAEGGSRAESESYRALMAAEPGRKPSYTPPSEPSREAALRMARVYCDRIDRGELDRLAESVRAARRAAEQVSLTYTTTGSQESERALQAARAKVAALAADYRRKLAAAPRRESRAERQAAQAAADRQLVADWEAAQRS